MSLRKFEILEMIAKGGMAEVYRAKTVGLEGFAKEVCVKKILPHLTEDQSFVTMFINEAKLAASLSYGNIVQVHDLCVSADREYFIVMEYVHGKDVSDVIRAAQLAGREIPPAIAAFVSREVCKGLFYAHTKKDADGAPLKIIHRDISPQNVLCSFMGEVKITDFGIAKASSIMNKTAVGILKGKYGYMSPEQARGEPLDHRSDIFNLGIVLYEMVVGERCFAGASDYSTLNLMREAQVTPPSKINKNVPAALEGIILKALQKHPADRHQDALELEGALAEYAKKQGDEAGATDLSRFMRELFSSPEPQQGRSTGVLNLSSVVGPAPAPSPQSAAPSKEREPAAPPPSPPELPPAAAAASKPPPPAQKSAPEPDPAAAAAAEAAEPAPAAPKPERKPARIKQQGKAEAKDRGPHAEALREAAAAKRPVGRKTLRPGLTDMAALETSGRKARIVKAACIIAAAGVAGAILGSIRTGPRAEQSIFREMELAGREPPPPDKQSATTLYIETDPPGAAVWLDKTRLADATPLAIERPRDAQPHELEIALDRHKTARRTFQFAADPVTVIREQLEADVHPAAAGPPGAKSSLRILSDAFAEIVLDGVATGQSTNDGALELEPGVLHEITLVDPASGTRRAIKVQLEAGEQRRMFLDL